MYIISWKMLLVATAGLIAVSVEAALDMYDEIQPEDISLMYQEHNDIAPEASELDMKADTMKSLLLYKMLGSFGNQEVQPKVFAGPKWISSGTILVPPETLDVVKEPMTKRLSEGDGNLSKAKGNSKPAVPKWKTRKVKSPPMICYFKLCAFRRRS